MINTAVEPNTKWMNQGHVVAMMRSAFPKHEAIQFEVHPADENKQVANDKALLKKMYKGESSGDEHYFQNIKKNWGTLAKDLVRIERNVSVPENLEKDDNALRKFVLDNEKHFHAINRKYSSQNKGTYASVSMFLSLQKLFENLCAKEYSVTSCVKGHHHRLIIGKRSMKPADNGKFVEFLYVDPYGHQPDQDIREAMLAVGVKNCQIHVSEKVQQKDGYNCGVYTWKNGIAALDAAINKNMSFEQIVDPKNKVFCDTFTDAGEAARQEVDRQLKLSGDRVYSKAGLNNRLNSQGSESKILPSQDQPKVVEKPEEKVLPPETKIVGDKAEPSGGNTETQVTSEVTYPAQEQNKTLVQKSDMVKMLLVRVKGALPDLNLEIVKKEEQKDGVEVLEIKTESARESIVVRPTEKSVKITISTQMSDTEKKVLLTIIEQGNFNVKQMPDVVTDQLIDYATKSKAHEKGLGVLEKHKQRTELKAKIETKKNEPVESKTPALQ